VPYDVWVRQEYITQTTGNVIDQAYIRKAINDLGKRYAIKEIAIDRWAATQITIELGQDGFTVVPFGQGFASMNAPTKEWEKLVLAKQIRHGGDPVMRWAVSNAVTETDAAGNLKPSKAKATERIDPLVAGVMALGRCMVRGESEKSGPWVQF
jgi:phage terminase large subunit-like protein